MDLVDGAVDSAGPVNHGPAAIAACWSSSELGLLPLRWPWLPDEGRRRERGARGSRFWAHRGSEGDGASAVKAAVGRALAWVAQGSEMGQEGAGEEWWEEGMSRRPFIGSEGERVAGRRRVMGDGDGAP
jgi:hypothetical protein